MPSASHPFDRTLRRLRLRRALAGEPPSFLLDRAAAEAFARLSAVNRSFSAILELGCATDAIAVELRRLYPGAAVTRLAPVREAASGSAVPAVVGDEEMTPFAAGSFDLALSLLALQDVNDLPGALAQVQGLLKPDGLFLACLIGGRSLWELRSATTEAESEILGGVSPRVSPFVDLRDLGALLQRAGFALPVTDVEPVVVRYADLFGLARDLRAMGAANALVERSRAPTPRRFWLRAAEIYAERFSDADGRVRASFDFVWLSGWAPHESQRKPLKPGSARARLADALGAKEGKLRG